MSLADYVRGRRLLAGRPPPERANVAYALLRPARKWRVQHQLPRAIVPRSLELQRDAAVLPQSQALLREGRTQDVSAQTLHPRKLAQAGIFKIIYPGFDGYLYTRALAEALPVSAALENSLVSASARMIDATRPLSLSSGPVIRRVASIPLPASLQSFAATGFRESAFADEKVQTGMAQAVALIEDRKPEAAAASRRCS